MLMAAARMLTIVLVIILVPAAAATTTNMPRAAVDVKCEPITLREWLGHMTLFHVNVQIRNYSARTIYILMRVESRADASAAAVPPHALEPCY
jgi:hypothetical protein